MPRPLMHLLFVQKDLYERSIGGSEFYEHHLARELSQRHEISVFCTDSKLEPAEGPRLRTVDGRKTIEVPPNNELYPASRRERAILRAFGELLDELRPDLVHVQDLYRLSSGIPDAAAVRGIPVVHTLHEFYLICPRLILRTTDDHLCAGPTPLGCARCGRDMARERYAVKALAGESWSDYWKRRLQAFAQRRASELDFALARRRRFLRAAQRTDLLLCPTSFLRDQLIEAGLPAARMRVVAHGLPHLGDPRPKTASTRVRFAFVGNVAVHKGIFVLLEAARSVPDADFMIYGPVPSPFAASVRSRMSELPNVKLAGILADGDKAEAYASIDVLVTPSIWYENPSLSILEAFYFRTPVVASRLGGMEEIVSRGGGWLVPAEDPAALAETLRRLSHAPEEILEAARSVPEVPSMTAHAREIETIYEEVTRAKAA